ncbi:hypothetical protein [Celeribacter sp.]|uniref:hypothetical protein n=1 Tax=Celeribacter sp. TaxID=1890673 RepID=UPI003A92CDAE
MKNLIMASAVIALIGSAAVAQSNNGECGAPSDTSLSSLAGPWSLSQGPGAAFAMAPGLGATALKLPAHPTQSVELTFTDMQPFGMISAQGQSMVMLPAGSEPTRTQIAQMSEEDGLQPLDSKGEDCGWSLMPSFVATTSYVLQNTEPSGPSLKDLFIKATPGVQGGNPILSIGVCENTSTLESLEKVIKVEDTESMFGFVNHTPDGPVNVVTTVATNKKLCDKAKAQTGDMQMLLYLQFSSPNSASGILSFKGEMNGNLFSARAPVILSR